MHHFPSRRKLVWLAFSLYWLWITNWKKCLHALHFCLFPWKVATGTVRPGQLLSSSVLNSYALLLQRNFHVRYRLLVLWRLQGTESGKSKRKACPFFFFFFFFFEKLVTKNLQCTDTEASSTNSISLLITEPSVSITVIV